MASIVKRKKKFSVVYTYTDEKNIDGYKWYQVESYWIASKDDWVILLPKDSPPEEVPKEETPRLIFTCQQTGKYLIYLQAGTKLYLEQYHEKELINSVLFFLDDEAYCNNQMPDKSLILIKLS